MRLAMRLPKKQNEDGLTTDGDPRESESAEVIDLASRSGFSPVAERKSKTEGLGLAAGVALVAGLGVVTYWAMSAGELPAEQGVGGAQSAQPAQAATSPVPVKEPNTTPKPNTVPPAVGAPRSDPAPAPILANPPRAVGAPAGNPYNTPSLIHDFSRLSRGIAATTATIAAGAADSANQRERGSGGVAGGSASDFARSIGGVGGGPAQAVAMSNPSTTVTKGTMIPAVLETAINTDVPGYVRAVVSQDVRSFDGKRILIPRSSRLIGQYQSGVQQGQKRAYVIWEDLIRPDGATIKIASPAIGFDGTTGLAGDVDTHFLSRFGSSILLSVVGGLGAIASGGTSIAVGAGQSAASTALQQDGQRSPTIRVKPGEPIRVFTARNLDFTAVSN